MDVGFVGLGDQGAPIVRAIAEAGHRVHVWARRAESVEPLRDVVTSVAADLPELGARSDYVGVCVIDAAGVREVCLAPGGVLAGMRPGSVLAIHSTIDPQACESIADAAEAVGVRVLDVPVSRRRYDAQLFTALVGGDADAVDAARPVLTAFSDHIAHLGPLGSGQRAKVINNVLLLANMQLALDAFRIGQDIGVDQEALQELLPHTSARSFALTVLESDPEGRADFPRLMAKELAILAAELEAAGSADSHLAAAARELLATMQERPWQWAPAWHEAPHVDGSQEDA